MSGDLGEPNRSPKAQAAPLHEAGEAYRPGHGGHEPQIPPFPVDEADRLIEFGSRWAGPLVFVLALGGLGWFLIG